MAIIQKVLNSKLNIVLTNRCLTSAGNSMNAWVCEEYKKPIVLRQASIPIIQKPNDVLVKVEASSVNPIDVRMCEGYAHEAMTALHRLETLDFTASKPHYRLPLITGRDFCGEVVQIGSAVQNVKIGDQVIGVIPAHWNGSHAEYALSNAECVAQKPKNIDSVHAAAMCYTFATVWSALTMAQVNEGNARNLRVLIHGGSGGIGTTIIQLLREWNAQKIVATCSEKNLKFVRDLGAISVDYDAPDVREQLLKEAPFDLILDCAQSPLTEWSDCLLGAWRNSFHISLVSPLMSNMDRYGVPVGLFTTAGQILCRNLENFRNGRLFMYAFFWPDKRGMEHLSTLLSESRLIPIVEHVYPFSKVPEAYAKVGKLHAQGKSVIDFKAATLNKSGISQTNL